MLEIFISSIVVQTNKPSLRTFRAQGGHRGWGLEGTGGAGARLLGWMYGSRRGGEGGAAGGGHGTTEAKLLSMVKDGTKVSWKDFMNITRR